MLRIYTGPDRHYHDLDHIKTLLALAEEHASEFTDREAVEAAIWFHDAVYDTRKADNEAESAKLRDADACGRSCRGAARIHRGDDPGEWEARHP